MTGRKLKKLLNNSRKKSKNKRQKKITNFANKLWFDIKKTRIEINSLRKLLLNLNFQKSTGQLEKTSEIKKTKKKIASLMTNKNFSKENNNV